VILCDKNLTEDRVVALKEIGFDWDPPSHNLLKDIK
jgi:hypothetical protein